MGRFGMNLTSRPMEEQPFSTTLSSQLHSNLDSQLKTGTWFRWCICFIPEGMKNMITIRSSNSDNSHTSICIKLVNLTIFFALGMMAIGIFVVATIFSANDGPSTRTKELLRLSLSNSISNIWATTILVFFLTCCLLLSKKGFRTFNLCKILKFLNLIQLIFPFLLFFSLTSFDFETTFETWIKHYWLLDGFTWYREAFCAEGERAKPRASAAERVGGGTQLPPSTRIHN